MHLHDNQLLQHMYHDICTYTMQAKGGPKAQKCGLLVYIHIYIVLIWYHQIKRYEPNLFKKSTYVS